VIIKNYGGRRFIPRDESWMMVEIAYLLMPGFLRDFVERYLHYATVEFEV
jgi:hypothetical protein